MATEGNSEQAVKLGRPRYQIQIMEVTMRRFTLIAFSMLVMVPWIAQAQESPLPRGTANAFFGGGAAIRDGRSGVLEFGAGGEGRIYQGLGAGAELGYLHPAESFTSGFGLLSTNGFYHFRTQSTQKVAPFVTAGYSLMFRDGHANLANFGGGVDYWFRDRTALRFEVRDHLLPGHTDTHFLMFRVGVVGF